MVRTSSVVLLAFVTLFASHAFCDQATFANSGGSASVHSSFVLDSTVTTPPGPLTVDCPVKSIRSSVYTTEYDCAGGSFTFLSDNGSGVVQARFTSGVLDYTCTGGGRGHPVTCGYNFTGWFSGTLTESGREQAIIGKTMQSSGKSVSGTTIYNSAYSPFYFTNHSQVLRSDDLQGTNLAAFGGFGTGKDQFYSPSGIALDASGRIYIADTYNDRIVRIDNIHGSNWIAYGSAGIGKGQFKTPSGVFVDHAGKVYVVDTGNSRIVRVDNLSGANWVAYGKAGSGVGEFSSLQSVAVDPAEHIYIPDPGNHRLVEIDDMAGSHWTVLTKSPVVNGAISTFQKPTYVALDSADRIYVADGTSLVRVNAISGVGWTSLNVGKLLTGLAVDGGDTVFAGGSSVKLLDSMAGFLESGAFGNVIAGIASVHLPSPVPAAIRLPANHVTFYGTQKVGTVSTAKVLTITNFGGSPLDISSIVTTGEFVHKTDCGSTLYGGSSCTLSLEFKPTKAGPANGLLTLVDSSNNAGKTQLVTLHATGK